MLGVLVAQVGQCIDGVAGSRHSKLNIGSPKLKIIIDSKFHHSEAVMLMCKRFLLFEGILRTDYKPNLVKPPTLKERLGDDQVSHMNGVETTEVQPNLHRYYFKNSVTKATVSAEDLAKSSLRTVTSNCGSKVISNFAL